MPTKRKSVTIKCPECGQTRVMYRADARYCSERCRQSAHRQRTLTIPGMEPTTAPEIDEYTERAKKKKKKKKAA